MAEAVLDKSPDKIRSMFGAIAHRYDLANTVLSLGIHHLWRTKLVASSAVQPGNLVLDAATGTGDLGFLFSRRVSHTGFVTGIDFSKPMLDQARLKSIQKKASVPFECADVLHLPFPSHTFDIVSIAFGIRNVSDTARGIAELCRVLKPGGRLLILEFGGGSGSLWHQAFRFYSRHILPCIGGLVTGNRTAYTYLEQSSAEFPSRETFVALMKGAAPFETITYESLWGGIAFLYRGIKPQ